MSADRPEQAWELFDLKEDPQEMRNVYGEPACAEIQRDLAEALKRLRKQYDLLPLETNGE